VKKNTLLKTLTPSLLAMTLVVSGGCNRPGGTEPRAAISATLTGTASKGTIKQGAVIAQELNAQGEPVAQVGSAITQANGDYQLVLNDAYTGGPIQVTVSMDGDAQMKCDIPSGCGARDANDGIIDGANPSTIDFGEWYKPGALTMTALVAEAKNGDVITASITPFTHLAAQRAKESGHIDAIAVYIANSEVSNMLGGVDILNTRPLDITDMTLTNGTPIQKVYAAFTAAIAINANATNGHPDLPAALATLSKSFYGGKISAHHHATNTLLSLQDIVHGAGDTLQKIDTRDVTGTLTKLQDLIDHVGADDTLDPQPSASAGSPIISKIKAFVSDLRTWNTVILNETEAEGSAFQNQINLASAAADAGTQLAINPMLDALTKAILKNIDDPKIVTDLAAYNLGFTGGTLTKVSGEVIFTNARHSGLTVNMTVRVPANAPNTKSIGIEVRSATIRSPMLDADVTHGTILLNFKSPFALNLAALYAGTTTLPDIENGSINFNLSLVQKLSAMNIPLSASVTFTGALDVTFTSPVKDSLTGQYIWITPRHLSAQGEIYSSDGQRIKSSLTANIKNADTFKPVGELPLGNVHPDLVTWAYSTTDLPSVSGVSRFTFNTPSERMTIDWYPTTNKIIVTHTFNNGYSYHYVVDGIYMSLASYIATPYNALSIYRYNPPSFELKDKGTYQVDLLSADFTNNGGANGSLIAPYFVLEGSGENQWLAMDSGFLLELQLAQLPKATVNINANRSGYHSGTGELTIGYGARKITTNTVVTNGTVSGAVTITNQDAVSVTLVKENGDQGTIQFNGQSYGTIEQLATGLFKITYADGTFETW